MQLVERRRFRSERTQEALSLQLQHVLEQQGLISFIVSDSDGFLLASAPSSENADNLAAYCPPLAHGQLAMEELLGQLTSAQEVAVALSPLSFQEETFYLLAVGPRGPGAAQAVRDAQGGVIRILRTVQA